MFEGAAHTNTDDVELEAALEKLLLNLACDAVETDRLFGVDWLLLLRKLRIHHGRHC